MRLNNQKGFTLIELTAVIVILGILAASALPTFSSVSAEAGTSSMNGTAAAIRSSLGIYYSNQLVNGSLGAYPNPLDGAAVGPCTSSAAPCFDIVIANGIVDARWNKDSATAYTYTNPDGTPTTFTYDDINGTFTPP